LFEREQGWETRCLEEWRREGTQREKEQQNMHEYVRKSYATNKLDFWELSMSHKGYQ
jgi:hypothetical protein